MPLFTMMIILNFNFNSINYQTFFLWLFDFFTYFLTINARIIDITFDTSLIFANFAVFHVFSNAGNAVNSFAIFARFFRNFTRKFIAWTTGCVYFRIQFVDPFLEAFGYLFEHGKISNVFLLHDHKILHVTTFNGVIGEIFSHHLLSTFFALLKNKFTFFMMFFEVYLKHSLIASLANSGLLLTVLVMIFQIT